MGASESRQRDNDDDNPNHCGPLPGQCVDSCQMEGEGICSAAPSKHNLIKSDYSIFNEYKLHNPFASPALDQNQQDLIPQPNVSHPIHLAEDRSPSSSVRLAASPEKGVTKMSSRGTRLWMTRDTHRSSTGRDERDKREQNDHDITKTKQKQQKEALYLSGASALLVGSAHETKVPHDNGRSPRIWGAPERRSERRESPLRAGGGRNHSPQAARSDHSPQAKDPENRHVRHVQEGTERNIRYINGTLVNGPFETAEILSRPLDTELDEKKMRKGVRSLFFAEGGGALDRLVDGQFKKVQVLGKQESKSETYTTRDGNTYNTMNQQLGTVMQYEEPKTFKPFSPAEAKALIPRFKDAFTNGPIPSIPPDFEQIKSPRGLVSNDKHLRNAEIKALQDSTSPRLQRIKPPRSENSSTSSSRHNVTFSPRTEVLFFQK